LALIATLQQCYSLVVKNINSRSCLPLTFLRPWGVFHLQR
uniref:Uncharacterized protein n=1 Tax=Haemonchus placei TaxID=6290 RepID=A0A0N4VYG2_HAEPC